MPAISYSLSLHTRESMSGRGLSLTSSGYHCCIVDGYSCCVVERLFFSAGLLYVLCVSHKHAESSSFCNSKYLFTLWFPTKQTRHRRNIFSFYFFLFIISALSVYRTKCIVMSRDQNAGRIHSVRIDNSTFESVEEFKYLGTTLTYQNSIAEEIRSRLRSANACYHSVQNLLSSRLLSKNLKIKIYRTCCFAWVWSLVADIEGGKEAEGVWEHGVEENIWT